MKFSKQITYTLIFLSSANFAYADNSLCNGSDTSPFGPNVCIFDSQHQATIQSTVNAIHNQEQYNEFGSNGFALFFKPGTYSAISVPVGFYTQVAGLGLTPRDTTLKTITVNDLIGGHSTTMFWRIAENLTLTDNVTWAVSQASPLRNLIFKGNLTLALGGGCWASGGFLANSEVDGLISPVNQQQWLSRNTSIKAWSTVGWNMVFVGDTNFKPSEDFPDTVVPNTPRIQEKPYLAFQQDYEVVVPAMNNSASEGPTWGNVGTIIPRNQFIIAFPGETADQINQKLNDSTIPNPKALIFTPGQYDFYKPINISTKNTVVLGLGLPVLTAKTPGTPIITTNAAGIKISGVIFEAGAASATADDPSLLQINKSQDSSEATTPTTLSDVYCRAGGRLAATHTNSCLTINDDFVIGDNLWLWRADHGVGANSDARKGLIVNGRNVTMYGLAVEHFIQQQVFWAGENGSDYFYQSEFPYDAVGKVAPSFIIADQVNQFTGFGLGIYDNFGNAFAPSAIQLPNHTMISLTHMVDVSLNRRDLIQHTIQTSDGKTSWGPASAPPAGSRLAKWPQ